MVVTVAVNCCVPPATWTLAVEGEIETVVELGFDEGVLGELGDEPLEEQPQQIRNNPAKIASFMNVQ